jgi:protein-tyrosine kinase
MPLPSPDDITIAAQEESLTPFLSSELVTLHSPGSPAAEIFRFLRSKITHPAEGDPPKSILVTSSVAGEGKSFVASNLAIAIAQSVDEHVLLIDTDLRNPRIHKIFELGQGKIGLSTHLSDKAPLEELIYRTPIAKLSILNAGNSTKQPSELLASQRMRQLIQEVRDRYPDRLVIFDSTPLELAPETFILANSVDGVVFVVRSGVTPRIAAETALERIRKEKLLGIVFNCYKKAAKTYKRYGYHHYKVE